MSPRPAEVTRLNSTEPFESGFEFLSGKGVVLALLGWLCGRSGGGKALLLDAAYYSFDGSKLTN